MMIFMIGIINRLTLWSNCCQFLPFLPAQLKPPPPSPDKFTSSLLWHKLPIHHQTSSSLTPHKHQHHKHFISVILQHTLKIAFWVCQQNQNNVLVWLRQIFDKYWDFSITVCFERRMVNHATSIVFRLKINKIEILWKLTTKLSITE